MLNTVLYDGPAGTPLLIAHGLFGSARNWNVIAKRLSETRPVVTVDMRNHGASPWFDTQSYADMAGDLAEVIDGQADVLGHSMGGKLAMHYDGAYPNYLEKLIVVDMGIKAYPPHHEHILAAMHAIDLKSMTARSQAEAILKTFVESEGIRQFLLKNLYWEDKGKLAWRVNFPVLEANMSEILKSLPAFESFTPTLFIRGLLSNYILDSDIASLEEQYPDLQLVSIENAGHWVHAEAPDAFMDAVLSFCLR